MVSGQRIPIGPTGLLDKSIMAPNSFGLFVLFVLLVGSSFVVIALDDFNDGARPPDINNLIGTIGNDTPADPILKILPSSNAFPPTVPSSGSRPKLPSAEPDVLPFRYSTPPFSIVGAFPAHPKNIVPGDQSVFNERFPFLLIHRHHHQSPKL